MRLSPLLTIGLCAALLAACSHRQVYEGLQAGKRQECQRMAEPERSRCLDSARTGYDEYERERAKVRPQ